MSEKVANIAKNTSYFTIALIIQKIISFSYFIIIARALGPDDLGKYYFAISFTTIFAIFIDLGFANVLTREVAKKPEDAQKLLGSVISMKIPLTAVAVGLIVVLINILDYPQITRELVYLSTFCVVLDSFSLTFYSAIRGFHNLKYESMGSVVFQLIVLVSGLVILNAGGGLRLLFLSLIAASLFYVIYAFILLKKFGISARPHFDWAHAMGLFKITFSFTLFAIFQKTYTYLDTVLISYFAGDTAVGLYQVAFKMLFALQFLPMAFTATLYPALSCYWVNNKNQLSITFERALNYLVIISLPISVGIIATADKIILLFKSGYEGAILPLQITIATLFFLFINFPIGSLLNACDRQRRNTVNMAIVLVISVIMNVLLIPRFEALGAGITVLSTHALMTVLGLAAAGKIVVIKYSKLAILLAKTLFSSFFMAACAFYLKQELTIFIVVPVSGAFYFLLMYMLNAFTKDDIFSILESLKIKKKI